MWIEIMARMSQIIAFLLVGICCEVFECHFVRSASFHFRASRSAGDAGTHKAGANITKPEVAKQSLQGQDPDVIITKPKTPEKDVLADNLHHNLPTSYSGGVRVAHGALGHDQRVNDAKYPIIAACHYKLETLFAKRTEVWSNDWKIWIGFTLWLVVGTKWVRSGFHETFMERALFAFGI